MRAGLIRPRGMRTLADIISKLGDIPPERILLVPSPGTANEADLIRVNDGGSAQCELVFGTLVEKARGVGEGKLEIWIGFLLSKYLEEKNIGELISASGLFRLGKGIVRAPDISFFTWKNATTEEEDRKNPIANKAPDLAIEVVSRSNTPKELARKRREYFKAGTTLVWQIYPKSQTVEVYRSPSRPRTLALADTLDGGELMPGLLIPLKTLFGGSTKPRK